MKVVDSNGNRKTLSANSSSLIVSASEDGSLYENVSGTLTAIPLPFLMGGRLTLTTGTPITTSDVTGAGTLYYTPYLHDRVVLYDGTRWKMWTFTERSLSLTLTSTKIYDIYLFNSSGTLTLFRGAAWTNNTTRADALTTQNGVNVNSVDYSGSSGPAAKCGLYLGTIYATGTNTTEDSVTNRVMVNQFNPVQRRLLLTPGYLNDGSSTTYTTSSTTWVTANGGTGASGAYVSLGNNLCADWSLAMAVQNGSGYSFAGIGDNSTTTALLETFGMPSSNSLSGSGQTVTIPALGYRTINLLVRVQAGTGTFSADDSRGGGTTDPYLTWLSGMVWG